MALRFLVLWFCLSAALAFGQAPKSPDPKKAKAAAAEAKAAFEASEYEKALQKFQEAYAYNPKPGYLANMGQCYNSMGHYPEAIETYQRFLTTAPANDPLRPAVEKEIAKNQAAFNALKESSAISAKASADAAFKALDYQKALGSYQEANSLSPKPEYLLSIAQCYAALGKNPEATASYQSFLDKAPADDPRRAAVQTEISKLEPSPTSNVVALTPTTAPLIKQPDAPPTTTKSPWPPRLFAGSAGLAALSGATGALALSSALKLRELSALNDLSQLDEAEIAKQRSRLSLLSPLSDALLIAAVASGAAGIIIRQKTKKTEVRAALLPNGASLGVQF